MRLKRLIPRSLFGRSLLLIVGPPIILQVVVALVFFELHLDKITQQLATAAAGETGLIVALLERADGDAARADVLAMARSRLGLRIRILPGERLPADGGPRPTGMLERWLDRALKEQVRRPAVVESNQLPTDVRIRVAIDDGVLEVVIRRERLFSGTAYVTLMWMVGASVLLIGLAVHFLRKQVAPIRRLASAAEAFGKGRTDVPLRLEGAREIRRAAAAFLAMRERIQRQVSQRTQMLAGVSHDLRTPLTRMKLELAMLPPGEGRDNLATDVRDMERMVEEYLAFARGEETEMPAPTDLVGMLREIVDRSPAGAASITLTAREPLTVEVRPDAIRRSIGNLIDNALRYARQIEVAAYRTPSAIEIAVDDNGPGIPEEAREDVFKPFLRLDESRNAETGGVGLGLTIARDAVRRHGGDLKLSTSRLGGLRALIRLPV
ncbi:MAG: HAMP domain-containing protein [Alphaproteobacteria bacterium]|nr:HAMP domain-containing protein [Alphaproteobacteria bacterium]